MKLTTIFLLLIPSLSFCQDLKRYKSPQKDKNDPVVWNITKNTACGLGCNTSIAYKPYPEIIKDIKEREFMSDSEIEQTIKAMPKGGFITIETKRVRLDDSNSQFLTLVIKQGETIQKYNGEKGFGEVYFNPITHYIKNSTFPIKEPLAGDIEVFVLDNLTGIKYEYLLKIE